MSAAPLAARLAAGDPLTALFAKMPCAAQVESAAYTGFDLVVLDTEHGPTGGFELEAHLRAAAAAGIPAVVRVPSLDPAAILGALDAGATGVVVPHVLDAAGAEAAVAAAHYPPRGRRGFATSTRAGRYGTAPPQEHLRRAAEETCVIVQIEDPEAVERADAILAVPGISAVLIGAADLGVSLGRSPDAEVDAVFAAAARATVPVMTVAGSAPEARSSRARGAQVIAFVSTGLIHAAFAEAVSGGRADTTTGSEPLILLPGMLGDAALWDDVAPALSGHAAVRFGRIDLDDAVEGMAAGVLACAPERFALAGHSLGAIVALEIVRRAPQRVTRLALLNASARPASDAQLEAWAELRQRAGSDGFGVLAREFAAANLPAARRADTALVDRVEAMAHAVGLRGLLRQLAAQATRPDSRPSLSAIAVPTLVLTGTEDHVCPRSLQEELVVGIPGAEHAVVEGAGHMAALEAPAAVAERLEAWLER